MPGCTWLPGPARLAGPDGRLGFLLHFPHCERRVAGAIDPGRLRAERMAWPLGVKGYPEKEYTSGRDRASGETVPPDVRTPVLASSRGNGRRLPRMMHVTQMVGELMLAPSA